MLNNVINPFPILTTERLVLRKLTPNDEQAIFTLRTDMEVNKYLDRPICNNVEDARKFIQTINENIDNNKALYWAISLADNNILVGTICLFSFSKEHKNCEIGYELLPNYQAQGIMKEAVEKVMDYAFNTLQVKTIEAFVHRNNQPCIKLLEKFSFINSNKIDPENPALIGYTISA
jgi:ribosomal-protein-alanine N-acetyltransferase